MHRVVLGSKNGLALKSLLRFSTFLSLCPSSPPPLLCKGGHVFLSEASISSWAPCSELRIKEQLEGNEESPGGGQRNVQVSGSGPTIH